jgi:hypothetical protein
MPSRNNHPPCYLKAVENGVSEERIAKSLNVDVASIRRRRKLLDGICTEAAELLKEKHIALNTFSKLRKLGAIQQIEAAELTLAMNNFSNSYVRALVAATPIAQLAPGCQPRAAQGAVGQTGHLDREGIRKPGARIRGGRADL